MTLEQQVCSLELAKRLKELGVKQESLCSWKPDRQQLPTMTEAERLGTQWVLFNSPPTQQDCSAFTVAELGEMLPTFFIHKEIMYHLATGKGVGAGGGIVKWALAYLDIRGYEYEYCSVSQKESDARAKMLIHLLENKLITL